MKHIFVDTGAWYALVDRQDPDHVAVYACLQRYQGRLLTSNFVLDETITLLRYRLGWPIAHTVGEQLRSGNTAQIVRITPTDEDTAWHIFTRYKDESFSFTDCSSFALMERLKLHAAVAIDSDFKKYGFQCLP
jgi:predicted nucleic acid-binding protein